MGSGRARGWSLSLGLRPRGRAHVWARASYAILRRTSCCGCWRPSAWRGEDRLGELLRAWAATTTQATSACLYLLAYPHVDGSREELHARVLDAGVDLEGAADITVLMESIDGDRDRRLHASVDAFVSLHDACEGHARMACAAGNRIVPLDVDELERFLREALQALVVA